jgi:uncharacterized protein YcbX
MRLGGLYRYPGVIFGRNLIPRTRGSLRLDDPVEVLASRE